MMIDPSETLITGTWLAIDSKVHSDEAEKRIHSLIATYFEEIAKDRSGWETLYRDPADGRYWQLTFPESELQGGGPRELQSIEESDAVVKFSLSLHPNP